MHTIEEIESKLDKCEKCLEDYEKQVEDKKTELEQFYKDTYKDRIVYGPEGKEIKCVKDGFGNVYDFACMYIKKQVEFIREVKSLNIVRQNKFNA